MARKDEDASSYVAVPATPKQHFLLDDANDYDANSKGATSSPMTSRGHWWWPWRRQKTLSLAEAYAQQPPFRARPNPLQNASILSIISVNWFQPVVSLGAQKILENEDFWAVCPQDSCNVLRERFVAEYAQQQSEQKLWGGLRISVSRVGLTLLWAFRREILVAAANFMMYLIAMSLQPFISQAILDFLNDRDNVFHLSSGYWLVVLMTGASFIGVTCLNYGVFICSRIGVNMRSMIMTVIYEKALTLSCEARQGYSTGEIMTMMSVDSDRVFNAMLNGLWLVLAPFAFVVTIVLVASIFDVVSALVGGVLLVAILYTSVKLGDRIGDAQRDLLTVVEERVKVTSEALQGIRVMKFYAWEDSLAHRVEKIRSVEVALYRRFHLLQVANAVLLFLTPVLLGGVVLGLYVIHRGDLSVTEVYTLIAIVNISRLAVAIFPIAIAALSQVRISMSRLDAYLSSEEMDTKEETATISSTAFDEANQIDQGIKSSFTAGPGSILVENAQFQWTRSSSSSTPDVVVVSTEETTEKELVDAAATASVDGFRLEGVNLQIDSGSLVMIVGTVGSGKSSLLNALLGEMILTNGSINVQGEVSYVSQESWIRNSSVKDNILFEDAFDADRYQRVLEATQLALDLHALPNGDQTEIGERGINLSGGQKTRVAIARAMYRSKYDILILDDPLSAVDPHVAHAIFNQCIVGLAKDKTRLLVLNSHYDLLQHADKILVVQDGCVAGDGTYNEILSQFPELGMQSATLDKLEKDVIDEHEGTHEEEHQHEAAVAVATAAKQRVESATEVSHRPEQKDGDADAAKLVQDEDRVKGKVSGSTYKSYFDETGFDGYLVVVIIFLVYAVSQSMRILVDWWQGHWAKNMPRDGVDPTYSGLWFGMWYLAFIVACSLMTFGRGVLLLQSCMRSSKNLHDELFRRVLSAPINRYFDVTPVGRILNRFSGDLDQMDSILPQQYQNFFQTTSVFLGSLVVCAMTSFWVGLSYLPMLLIFVVTGLYFKKTSREVKRLDGISRTPVFNLFGETLNGLATIRAFKMQDKFVKLNKEAVDNNATFYLSYWAAGRWLAIRLDWLSVLIIFVVSLYLVGTKGQVDPVIAGISLTYSLMLTSMVQWVVRAADMTDNAMTSVERLLHFRNIPFEDDGANATPINSELWPSQGAIKFDRLCLKYRPELPLVLRGVNMDIQGGEKVGICGRTGAGKSSLMIALFRICEFESGTVFIDGMDIQSVKLRDLRRSLAIIPQDPVLYSGSLRENLDPFGEYSDEAIWSILQQVHLSDSVTKWGAGLDFLVSEQGDNLSVGQRQLMCIARALLKDSKIVVLDEATANVDTATDNLIQVTIKETFSNKTVLIIAHRINTILHCDKIAVMDAGQVAEFGPPSDLLSQPDSIFASLAKRSVQH
ncbi:Abc transporter c family member 2, partial [Globisporangium splendens]